MTGTVLDHWQPVTYDYGLIRCDAERVVEARRRQYLDAGVAPKVASLGGSLQDCLSTLVPLSPAPTKEMYLTTTFGWTAYLANGCRGSDPSLPMKQLSTALGVMALRACVTPTAARYAGVILEVYDTVEAGGDEYGYRRSIAALNDGGRWVFEQSGTPFPFEDTARYAARRKRDRFTAEMLAGYLVGLGAQRLSDGAFGEGSAVRGVVLERPAQDHLPRYTLEEAKALIPTDLRR